MIIDTPVQDTYRQQYLEAAQRIKAVSASEQPDQRKHYVQAAAAEQVSRDVVINLPPIKVEIEVKGNDEQKTLQ